MSSKRLKTAVQTFLGNPLEEGPIVAPGRKNVFDFIIRTLPIASINNLVNILSKGPYKEMNDTYKCIFIHIPKNAGNSIQNTLFPEESRVGHRSILAYKLYDYAKFSAYYKFSFVRNPFDRLVSAYFFIKQGGMGPKDVVNSWADSNLKDIKSFEQLVLNLKNPTFAKRILSWRHFRPQYTWLIDEYGNIAVDFVGRVEDITNDVIKIQREIRPTLSIDMRKDNESTRKDYQDYYTKEMRNIVASIYRKDIKLFGYSFNQITTSSV